MKPRDKAIAALAHRLADWRVPDPATRAAAFIDDLLAHGWDPPDRAAPPIGRTSRGEGPSDLYRAKRRQLHAEATHRAGEAS